MGCSREGARSVSGEGKAGAPRRSREMPVLTISVAKRSATACWERFSLGHVFNPCVIRLQGDVAVCAY
jgi:hypothetical protein